VAQGRNSGGDGEGSMGACSVEGRDSNAPTENKTGA